MATPVTVEKNQFRFEIGFTNASGSSASRSFTFDAKGVTGAALSAAQEFQNFLVGAGSTSMAIITPDEFIQPAGWRDNDPAEPPWTTQKVGLFSVTTYETNYGQAVNGGGGGTSRDFIYEINSAKTRIYFYYLGAGDTLPKVFNSAGQEIEVDEIADENYRFEITVTAGNTYFFFTPAFDGYAPLSESVYVEP